METKTKINVEVAYADINFQHVVALELEEGVSIGQAIEHSGILLLFPEINLATQKIGIFSQQKKLTDQVKEGDRIEIYRSLIIDPKEARKKRAKKKSNS